MYYQIELSGLRVLAGPIALPPDLAGLSSRSLADLSAALDPCPPRWAGIGYWPARTGDVAYDPETQRLSDQLDETPDAATCTVLVKQMAVNLTPAEVEVRAAARLATAWSEIRIERDARLLVSDRASLVCWADRWAAQTAAWREEWTAYRQALRNLPETYAAVGPLGIKWPTPPTG